jgi:hypothetical protein
MSIDAKTECSDRTFIQEEVPDPTEIFCRQSFREYTAKPESVVSVHEIIPTPHAFETYHGLQKEAAVTPRSKRIFFDSGGS